MQNENQQPDNRGRWRGKRRVLFALGALTVTGVIAATLTPALASDSPKSQTMRNEGTNLCLTADSGGAVYTAPCSSSDLHQKWIPNNLGRIVDNRDLYLYQLRNEATNECLHANAPVGPPPPSVPLNTVPCKFDALQQWFKIGPQGNSWSSWRGLGVLDSDQPSGQRASVKVDKYIDGTTTQNWLNG